MINDVRANEIRLELKKLQQDKENYEALCKTFKTEITECQNENLTRGSNLDYQQKTLDELKDKELKHLVEHSRELYNGIENLCGGLSALCDDECRKYVHQCEGNEDALLRELNRLEVQ